MSDQSAQPGIIVGAIVRLASSAVPLTVVERSGIEARVVWLDDMSKPQELTVDVRALRPWNETPERAPKGSSVQ